MFQKLAVVLCSVALLTGLGGVAAAQERSADVLGNKGQKIGSIEVRQGPHGVLLRILLDAGALTPGWHGVHIHEVGDCSDHGKFMHSKGHVNPTGVEHGFLNPKGPHPSDLPNIFAFTDGSSQAEMFVPGVSLTGGKVNLLDDDGTAVVIHADPDDHMTQPIGGAGARVGCAELK